MILEREGKERGRDREREMERERQNSEDGSEIGGSGVHFPSAPVKHLADLRSRGNSQRYSSIYED